jgi:hypothetical protein
MIAKYCFWFQSGNAETDVEYPPGQGTVHLKAERPGCYLDEHGAGPKLCTGICPRFYTTDKEAIKMLKGNDYQAAREWQRKGRPKGKKKGRKEEEDVEVKEEE